MKVTLRVIFTEETLMTPEAMEPNWWSEPLIWVALDCEMKNVLDAALSLLPGHPKLQICIEEDQESDG